MGSNLETVGKIYEAFGRGDIPLILGHLAEDVQWEHWQNNYGQKAGVPWLQAGNGHAGALAFFQVVGGWTITEFQVLALMDGGDHVCAKIEIAVTIPDTGASFRDEELHLWEFDAAGKVARFRHYVDTAKHIAAAQLTAPAAV